MTAQYDQVIKAAAKLKSLELEIGRLALPLLADPHELDRLARLAGVKTNYLIEMAMVAGGLRKRHRGKPVEIKKSAA